MNMTWIKRIAVIALAAALTAPMLPRGAAAEGAEGVFRLHIIANSDSEDDQRIKLEVRDRVLMTMQSLGGCKSARDTESKLMQNGKTMLEAAENVLAENGTDYGAQLVVGEFDFPDRVYGDKVYPRGRYRALRIVLGEGKGHNWWCVMFPPLCIAETDNGEIDINKLELKSWIIEKLKSIDGGKLWEKLMSRLG